MSLMGQWQRVFLHSYIDVLYRTIFEFRLWLGVYIHDMCRGSTVIVHLQHPTRKDLQVL